MNSVVKMDARQQRMVNAVCSNLNVDVKNEALFSAVASQVLLLDSKDFDVREIKRTLAPLMPFLEKSSEMVNLAING